MLTAWRLKDFDLGQGKAAGAASGTDEAGWIDVAVPGDTYLALHAAGRLPDPFAGANEAACQWVAEREWWWRTTFHAEHPAADERLTLTFLGLDTFAEVFLNGKVLGGSDNMFVPAVFQIGDLIDPEGPNLLAVRFTPPTVAGRGLEGPCWPIPGMDKNKRNLMRKAQFGWGWDWGPTLPTVGLWRPAALRRERRASLSGLDFATTSLAEDGEAARVAVSVEADVFAANGAAVEAEVTLEGPDGRSVGEARLCLEGVAKDPRMARCEFTLSQPALWETPEFGGAALHTLTAVLRVAGEVVDERRHRVGVRTITLDTSPDPGEPGADFFRFVLNGRPIFARGACWIPASSFVGAVDEARYRPLLEAAAAANMNMIRVWGGGVYEHDAFYDLCDELGLLVWQDFMFACAPYPEAPEAFVESVEAEVACQVERLRRHPCLALWCGNNECQVIQAMLPPPLGALYYDEIMPALVGALDPATPYWPGSPAGGAHPNSMRSGDVHDWTVWHGYPPTPDDRPVGRLDRGPTGVAFTRYAEDMGRFISEYGIQAAPTLETLRRALPPEELVLGSEGLAHRIKDVPKNKIDAMMAPLTGLPTTIEDYVDFTMITQAEGLKFGIEHFRRRAPHCSGSLIWQLNDCWPGVSWSLLDYHGFGKAGLYYVRRAYAPLLASFKRLDDGAAELWITNDTAEEATVDAVVELAFFAGGAAWSERVTTSVPAGASRAVCRLPAERLTPSLADPGAAFLHVRETGGRFFDNRLFFAAIKDISRPSRVTPAASFEASAGALTVTLRASDFAYFTHLLTPFEATRFSDNYIDLRAGEERAITVTHPGRALTPADVTLRSR